jgi:eukaryotic-like serine/threonine-protein kinase
MAFPDPNQTRVAVVDPLVGAVIDRRYRIEFRLAAGGFGAIYRASHVINGRTIALKVLHPSLATQPDIVARFRREAETLAQLRSPHTIAAYDFGQTTEGVLYIAMELLQGESLYERFRALGPLPWRRMAAIARQVCSALAEAHALGIIHRDLKPTNIHLEQIGGDPDYVKVLDFGIAKILHGSSLDNADLTRVGQMVGTFDYMAPEQMVGAQTSGASDIYTLGVVMYEMITGERPFGSPETPATMLTAILSQTPSPMTSFADVPSELDALVMRCLDRDIAARFTTVIDVADELDRLLAEDDRAATTVSTAPAHDEAESGGDSLTWVDAVPPAPPSSNPLTTLPGVAAPNRTSPWPLVRPGKKP